MHFSASTIMLPYLYHFSAMVQKIHFLVPFRTNLHHIWDKFSIMIKKIMPKNQMHLLEGLFRMNLVSNISTKASKKHHLSCQISSFLVQIKCIFNVHFSCSSSFKIWYENEILTIFFLTKICRQEFIGSALSKNAQILPLKCHTITMVIFNGMENKSKFFYCTVY